MSSATSVIRRYTPPTCTLEIAGKNSPLSRWVGQSALKNVRFKLSFDDPRVGEDHWVTVRGDRTQLQSLCDAITTYVQQFLSHSSTLADSIQQANVGSVTVMPADVESNPAGIYLEPKGMISHELYLGTLANEESGSSIRLSAVQLADLATALDEYSADVTAIPTLNRPSWANNPPAWGKIAAASLVAVGLGTTAVQVFDRQARSPQVATSQAPSSSDQRLAIQPLPNTQSPSPLPLPSVSPLPIGSLPPTTNAPEPSIASTSSPQPSETSAPNLKVTEKSPEGVQGSAPQPQLNIPTADVPAEGVRVNPIPNQTGGTATAAAKQPSRTAKATQSADPEPPGGDASAIASSQISEANRSAAPQALRQPAPAPASSSQASDVRAYIQQRWKQPEALMDQIEYRVIVAPNGTVEAIQPLGEVAEKFLDRTPIPVKGTQIASPGKSVVVMRLVFRPNSPVQVFQEQQ
jgi:Domain of unknown function (DUF4335)